MDVDDDKPIPEQDDIAPDKLSVSPINACGRNHFWSRRIPQELKINRAQPERE